MNQGNHSHVELTQMAVMLRDLTETVQVHARELNRLAMLVEQQTDLRDRPAEVAVAASTAAALHQQASRLAERLEGAD
ncbi:MAG: hypothetical protein ACODAD_05275 [Planctomycetota bacterium]